MWIRRRRQRDVSGVLARLVAVLAVVAGLVVLLSPRCADGMILDMPLVAGATAHVACHAGTAAGAGGGTAANRTMTGHSDAVTDGSDRGDSRGVNGILGACLVFLVAALAALVALTRPPMSRLLARPGPAPRRRREHPFPARELGLAQLCVLRT